MNDLKRSSFYREKKQWLFEIKRNVYATLNARRMKLRRIPGTKKRK